MDATCHTKKNWKDILIIIKFYKSTLNRKFWWQFCSLCEWMRMDDLTEIGMKLMFGVIVMNQPKCFAWMLPTIYHTKTGWSIWSELKKISKQASTPLTMKLKIVNILPFFLNDEEKIVIFFSFQKISIIIIIMIMLTKKSKCLQWSSWSLCKAISCSSIHRTNRSKFMQWFFFSSEVYGLSKNSCSSFRFFFSFRFFLI